MTKNGLSRRDFLKIAGVSGAMLAAPGMIRQAMAAPLWSMTGLAVPELAAFDNAVRAYMEARNIRSGSLAVTYQGRLVLARGYGYSTTPADIPQPISLFRTTSLSKIITAAAIMRLVQDGRLALNQKVSLILNLTPPPGQLPDARLQDVTIHQLLQHRGGWDKGAASFDPMFRDAAIASALGKALPVNQGDIMRYMTGQALNFNPGAQFKYSNYGYLLLGRVIEQVTGMPYSTFVQQEVFDPLLVTRAKPGRSLAALRQAGEVSYYSSTAPAPNVFGAGNVVPPYGSFNLENMDANGGWIASAVDLARLATAFENPATSPLFTAGTLNTIFALPPTGLMPNGCYYGCGWLVRDLPDGRKYAWHDGRQPGAFSLLVRRGDGINIAALFNQRDDASGLNYYDIDGALFNVASTINTWPTHDLFPELLTVTSAANAVPVRNQFNVRNPTLTWARVSWAQGYSVQIATDIGFTKVIWQNDALSKDLLSVTVGPPPLSNSTYFWRVRALQSSTAWGPWSAADTFAVYVTT